MRDNLVKKLSPTKQYILTPFKLDKASFGAQALFRKICERTKASPKNYVSDTNKFLAKILGHNSSDRTIRRYLAELQDLGLVYVSFELPGRQGRRIYTYYEYVTELVSEKSFAEAEAAIRAVDPRLLREENRQARLFDEDEEPSNREKLPELETVNEPELEEIPNESGYYSGAEEFNIGRYGYPTFDDVPTEDKEAAIAAWYLSSFYDLLWLFGEESNDLTYNWFKRIPERDKARLADHAPKYILFTPDRQYRKGLKSYLAPREKFYLTDTNKLIDRRIKTVKNESSTNGQNGGESLDWIEKRRARRRSRNGQY